MAAVGLQYVQKLQGNLTDSATQDIMNMPLQRRQTFDKFIAEDLVRLYSYAQYFAHSATITKEEFQEQLTMFDVVDSLMAVICLEDGWYCSNAFADVRQLSEAEVDSLQAWSRKAMTAAR